MGKWAAATTATVLIERFACARVLFTGVAGGLGQQVRVGDVVVARQYLQRDMDASPLCPRWELPGYGRADVACDPALSILLLQAAQDFLRGHLPGKPAGLCGCSASAPWFGGQRRSLYCHRTSLQHTAA